MRIWKKWLASLMLAGGVAIAGCGNTDRIDTTMVEAETIAESTQLQQETAPRQEVVYDSPETGERNPNVEEFDLSSVPGYSGQAYVPVNGNIPYFSSEELTTESFETYSPIDSLGRCGVANACIGEDLMPTEERGSIGQVKPSGWQTVKYDNVDGKYLYNRCHLIGYQLTAENANEENLITGTRYLNVEGMLPFENMVADYIHETGNHVMYRVTPVFEDNNLIASGVLMEGKSVEDNGEGVLFCVYAYNVQPGISIDYATGGSMYVGDGEEAEKGSQTEESHGAAAGTSINETYILNTNTKKFHKLGCLAVEDMNDTNKEEFTGSREELIGRGYEPCKRCNP